jgi:hypothetical protein
VEIVEGEVEISGVEETTVVSAREGANVEIDDAHGNIHVASDYGRIRLKGVVGDVDSETQDGRIRIDRLEGRLHARSRHGDIDVEFRGNPAGVITTEAGSIDVEVPNAAAFDLYVHSVTGSVELEDRLDFQLSETEGIAVGPLLEQDIQDAARLGSEVAAEVHHKLRDRIRRYFETRRRGARDDAWNEDWEWSWDDPQWRWRHHDWAMSEHEGWNPWRRWRDGRGNDGDTGRSLSGTVNGGGALLQLRTRGGRIRVGD